MTIHIAIPVCIEAIGSMTVAVTVIVTAFQIARTDARTIATVIKEMLIIRCLPCEIGRR